VPVIHAAGSVKGHVDPAVFANGVTVSSAAQANAVPVAEYTVSAIVFAAKRAFTRANWYAHDRTTGEWRSGAGTGLFGRTIGIIGASRTGRLVLDRLRVHNVRLLLADPYVTAQQAHALGAELVDTDELCRRSELVSIHAPALPETYHLLDARRLALLQDGATLINTARGSLVDTAAITHHCATGRLDAVLDVSSSGASHYTAPSTPATCTGSPDQGVVSTSERHGGTAQPATVGRSRSEMKLTKSKLMPTH
jgi:phosphoglycerate dehydrogenase-like enzyme